MSIFTKIKAWIKKEILTVETIVAGIYGLIEQLEAAAKQRVLAAEQQTVAAAEATTQALAHTIEAKKAAAVADKLKALVS